MSKWLVARLPDIGIIKAQTDIIVTAHIIEPGRAVEFVWQAADALIQQFGVFGGDCIPKQSHIGGVVGDLAFFGVDRVFAEVLGHFNRRDDRLSNKQHPGRGHLTTILHEL